MLCQSVTVGTHSGRRVHPGTLPRHHKNAIFDHSLRHNGRLRVNVDTVRADIGTNLITWLKGIYGKS